MDNHYHTKRYPVSVLVRFTKEQKEKLDRRAKAHKISLSEVIRQCI